MLTRLRETLRSKRMATVEVCEACGTACDAGCRSVAARDAIADQVLMGGPWR